MSVTGTRGGGVGGVRGFVAAVIGVLVVSVLAVGVPAAAWADRLLDDRIVVPGVATSMVLTSDGHRLFVGGRGGVYEIDPLSPGAAPRRTGIPGVVDQLVLHNDRFLYAWNPERRNVDVLDIVSGDVSTIASGPVVGFVAHPDPVWSGDPGSPLVHVLERAEGGVVIRTLERSDNTTGAAELGHADVFAQSTRVQNSATALAMGMGDLITAGYRGIDVFRNGADAEPTRIEAGQVGEDGNSLVAGERRMIVSPDRREVFVFGLGAMSVIDTVYGTLVRTVPCGWGDEMHRPLAFTPDGNYLYMRGPYTELFRMDVQTGAIERVLDGGAQSMVFTPDGSRAYVGTWDGVGVLERGEPISVNGDPGDGTVGEEYSFRFRLGGDPLPTVRAEGLPAGVELEADGHLHGRPREAGRFTFTVTATNADGETRRQVSMTVRDAVPHEFRIVGTLKDATQDEKFEARFRLVENGGRERSEVRWFTTDELSKLPGGIRLSQDGTLSGIPTEVGAFAFTVTATDPDTGRVLATKELTLTVRAADQDRSLSITGTPPAGEIGTPYGNRTSTGEFRFTLTGDPTPTVKVTAGALPPGLTLEENGTVLGVPTAAGNFSFAVTADNGHGTPATATTTIAVTDPYRTIIVGDPLDGVVGEDYDYQFTIPKASIWSPDPSMYIPDENKLPQGLVLHPDGHLTGCPEQSGTFTFPVYSAERAYTTTEDTTAAATEDTTAAAIETTTGPVTAQRVVTMTIHPPAEEVPLTIVKKFPNPGHVGEFYHQQIPVLGGSDSNRFTAEKLPPGLTLSGNGVLSGTPTQAGTHWFTLTVENDDKGERDRRQMVLTVWPNTDGHLEITGFAPPTGKIGAPYEHDFTVIGGSPDTTHRLYSPFADGHQLPVPGLTLTEDGHITGTPTEAGDYVIEIRIEGETTTLHTYLHIDP